MKKLAIILMLITIPLLSSCTQVISNPDIQTLNRKAAELMNSGDIKGAIARLEAINDLNPNFPQNYYNLGIAYYQLEEYEKAIDSLKKAIELDNKNRDSYYTIGLAYNEIALLNTEKLEQLKNPDEKKEAENTEINVSDEKPLTEEELTALITESLKNSQEYLTQYINLIDKAEEIEQIEMEIGQISEELKKYEPEISAENIEQ